MAIMGVELVGLAFYDSVVDCSEIIHRSHSKISAVCV